MARGVINIDWRLLVLRRLGLLLPGPLFPRLLFKAFVGLVVKSLGRGSILRGRAVIVLAFPLPHPASSVECYSSIWLG